MRKRADILADNLMKSQYFRRMLLSLTSIFLVALVVVSSVLCLIMGNQYVSLTANSMTESMQDLKLSVDSFFSKMSALASAMMNNKEIVNFLSAEQDDKVVSYLALRSLGVYRSLDPTILNLTLINDDRSVSNRRLQNQTLFFKEYSGETSLKARRITMGNGASLDVISILFPFVGVSEQVPRGIIVDVAQDTLQHMLDRGPQRENYVIDERGTLVSVDDASLFLSGEMHNDLMARVLQNGDDFGSFYANEEQSRYIVSYNRLNDTGWYAVALFKTTTLFSRLFSVILAVAGICLTVFAAAYWMIYRITKRNYAPIRRLLQTCQVPEQDARFGDTDLLSNVFYSLDQENNELRGYLHRHYLYALLTGMPQEMDAAHLEAMQVEYAAPYYRVCIVHMPLCDVETLTQAAFALDDALFPLHYAHLLRRGSEIIVLLCLPDAQLPQNCLHRMTAVLDRMLPTPSYHILLSDAMPQREKVADAFSQAELLIQFAFYAKDRSVLTSGVMQEHNELDNDCRSLIGALISDVQRCSPDAVQKDLAQLKEQLLALRPEACRIAATQVLEALAEQQYALSPLIADIRAGYAEINSANHFDEVMDCIHRKAAACVKENLYVREQNAHVRTDNLSKAIQLHVEEHFSDSVLSISEIAENIGMSSGYISRIFKANVGMTINEYITSVRLSKAADMLRNTDMTVAEIATAAGYNSVSYFATQFHKHMGYKPTAYRGATDEQE
ncbi:MAG: helix-turn-helix domain-containing protein [Eubacteriales bacterium]|nr:helix-turn-helix domain-containing protein [Eubacteriales bacterium]